MRIILLFIIFQITFFSNLNADEIDLNDPFYKLGWKNLENPTISRIEIPDANASIEIVDSEIYLDTKEDIKNYEEYLYGEETSIDDITESLIISDKEQYYTIKVRYFDEGHITTDRFKNFTPSDIIETYNKRKPDGVNKISWVLEPSLSEDKISNYGYRLDWAEGDATYIYYGNILGRNGYFSLLKVCNGMIGNSSSGIIEAASFGKFVINLGSRQKGRVQSQNVLNCKCNKLQLIKSINKLKKLKTNKNIKNIYYKTNSSQIIISSINKYLKSNQNKTFKNFYNFK